MEIWCFHSVYSVPYSDAVRLMYLVLSWGTSYNEIIQLLVPANIYLKCLMLLSQSYIPIAAISLTYLISLA